MGEEYFTTVVIQKFQMMVINIRPVLHSNLNTFIKSLCPDFSGCPVVRAPCFTRRENRFNPWSGTKVPQTGSCPPPKNNICVSRSCQSCAPGFGHLHCPAFRNTLFPQISQDNSGLIDIWSDHSKHYFNLWDCSLWVLVVSAFCASLAPLADSMVE